jgi:hypothetical protein
MTLSSTANRTVTSGNGSTTAFTFPYLFFADDDLTVILKVDSTGVETTKTITTHFTVVGAGVVAGGTVTMNTPPASGETLVILREEQFTQGLDLVENDPFPSDSVEQQLDTLTMLLQQLNERVGRALYIPVSDASGASTALPAPDTSKVLAWDATGLALENKATDEFAGPTGATGATGAAGADGELAGTPTTSVDNSIARWDGTGGATLDDTTGWTISDSDVMNGGDAVLQRAKLKDYSEEEVAKGSLGATPAFDLSAGNVQSGTNSQAITSSTMTNWPTSGDAGSLTIILTNGGAYSVAWPSSVDWPGGSAPTLTTSGVDILVFTSIDAGTTIHGMIASTASA